MPGGVIRRRFDQASPAAHTSLYLTRWSASDRLRGTKSAATRRESDPRHTAAMGRKTTLRRNQDPGAATPRLKRTRLTRCESAARPGSDLGGFGTVLRGQCRGRKRGTDVAFWGRGFAHLGR